MYLESVPIAAQEVIGDIGDKSLRFEMMSIDKPSVASRFLDQRGARVELAILEQCAEL